MKDKRQIKMQIITCLCGDQNLSERFKRLLDAGGLTENDGKIIRQKLVDQLDSNYSFHLLFIDYYIEQLKDRDDYPADEMREYTSGRQYLKLLDQHFPQTVSEAVDTVIGMLDADEIKEIKSMSKSGFRRLHHFGLGLFMRNHFGLNLRQSGSLKYDIGQKSGRRFLMADDVSGYLLEEVWEEIQRRD